jgi:hypothetical protein
MTRQGPSKRVSPEYTTGRLENARAFRKAAKEASDLADPGANGNPIIAHVVKSAIGYGDALTSKILGVVNQQDHSGIVRLLRSALANRLPDVQEKRLRKILSWKDDADYSAARATLDEARSLLEDIERFADWAEQEMARKS